MTKKDLIKKIQTMLPDFPKRDINFAVNIVFEGMKRALSGGEKIEIRNFGVFGVTERKSRVGRNPKTGAEVYVPARNAVFFKTGKELMEMVNRKPDS
ncbi:MAG: integration host factor subunit beta [Syntrophobacterales bacterium]|nr:integration host factor subunit beta [Syntrophobacterales bacterium]